MRDPTTLDQVDARVAASTPGPTALGEVTWELAKRLRTPAEVEEGSVWGGYITEAHGWIGRILEVVEAARKWDEELELVAYTALQEHGAAVQCPGCDGNGDDIRHDGTCTLCTGTGELNYHRLLDVATELDRLRLQVEGLGRAKTSDA